MQFTQKNFHKKLLGRVGEKRAVKYLKSIGYEILETNFTTDFGEIDIVAKDKDFIVFVEVKTRSSVAFGSPSEAVNAKKREKYKNLASLYLLKSKTPDHCCRFDVIEIVKSEINHIINAFLV